MKYKNLLSHKKKFSGEKSYKYFIGYIDDYKMKPFSIILSKTSAYIKSYDG